MDSSNKSLGSSGDWEWDMLEDGTSAIMKRQNPDPEEAGPSTLRDSIPVFVGDDAENDDDVPELIGWRELINEPEEKVIPDSPNRTLDQKYVQKTDTSEMIVEDSARLLEKVCLDESAELDMERNATAPSRNDKIENGEKDGTSPKIQEEQTTFTISESTPPHTPLEVFALIDKTVAFETLMGGILTSPNLRFLKMESVVIEAPNGVVMTELELFDAFKELVAFSPLGHLALNLLFGHEHMRIEIGRISSKSGQMLQFFSHTKYLASSLPRIGRTLEMLSSGFPSFALTTLALRGVTLEETEGIRRIFQNLIGLSLKDVLFLQGDAPTPAMPSSLLKSLTQLVKFRVEITKDFHRRPTETKGPTPYFPRTVTNLALLGFASWYFRPPVRAVQFEYVQVTDMRGAGGHVPINTKHLSLSTLKLLSSALTADFVTPNNPLQQILLVRSKESLRREQNGKVNVALLMKQLCFPIDEKKVLLFRKNYREPWKIEVPSPDDDGQFAAHFLNEFSIC